MKAQSGEGDGRIMLGNNTGGEALILRLIRFQCLEFGFQLDTPQYTYVLDHMNIFNFEMRKIRHASDLSKPNYWVNRGVCVRQSKAKTL